MKVKIIVISFLVGLLLLLVATLGHRAYSTPTLPQPQTINKTGTWLQNATEASWFTWSGNLYYIYTDRDLAGSDGKTMKIIKWSDKSLVSTFGTNYGCQDVYVDNSTLYVFATSCHMDFTHKGNSIVMFSTTDLTTFSAPTTIKTADANTQYYNISADKNTSNGNYFLAYEGQTSGNAWSTKFIYSSNLSTWNGTGSTVTSTPPEVKYLNGSYYMWLGSGASLHTWMMKSPDLNTWTWSRIEVLRPTQEFEDINTTDIDVIEFGGTVYGLYMTGDQSTYMRLTYFTYAGSMAQFVEAYQQPN